RAPPGTLVAPARRGRARRVGCALPALQRLQGRGGLVLKTGQVLALGAAGSLAFLASCMLVGHGLLDASLYSDLHVYSTYGCKMAAGQVPYRNFFDEYPPLAQPVFLLARVAGASHYALAFKSLMALFGVGAIACAVVTLRALRVALVRSVAAIAVIGVAPLLVGPIFLNAYDLWPAFLLSLALM